MMSLQDSLSLIRIRKLVMASSVLILQNMMVNLLSYVGAYQQL